MAEVPQENDDIISVSSTSSEEDYKEDEEAAAATVAAAAMSTPPRRSTRSSRVSLSPSNTESSSQRITSTITETRSSDEKLAADICTIYHVIKHDGWMKPKNGKLFNWIFAPPSINKLIQDKEITYKDLLSKGTDGDHYAEGWMKLGEMFLTYGTNHAPKNLSRSPPNPLLEGYTIERLYDELICEEPKKPAAASKSTESVGVEDTFTPVGSISTGSTSTGSTPAVSEANSNATKRKQDESKSTSSRKKKKKKNSPASSTAAAAAGGVSPIEGGLLNASNFFEEAQKRYFEYAALETAKKNQEAENKELVNKVRGLEGQMKEKGEELEGQMKEKGEELSAMMAQLTEKTDAMKHLEDKVEALKRGKLALDDEVEALKRGKHALETENRRLKSDMERLRRRSSPPSDDEDILRGLDKELIEKINNQIVNNGEEVTLDQIAGLENAKETVHQLVTYPMKCPGLFTGLRACPKGLLLFGPPGTGKTTIAKAIAHESGATFFSLSSSDLTSKWLGEGEKLVKTLFAVAAYQAPSIVFIDEVDSMLTHRRAEEDDAIRRMKTEFLVQLDGAGNRREGRVLVMGATNRPQDLDKGALRRFAKRLYLPLPNQPARETLLRTLVAKNSHSLTDDDFKNLSRDTEGYSGADLKDLCNDASFRPVRTLSLEAAMRTSPEDVPPISYEHFCQSLRITSPSVGQEDLQAYVDWSNAHGTKPDFLGN